MESGWKHNSHSDQVSHSRLPGKEREGARRGCLDRASLGGAEEEAEAFPSPKRVRLFYQGYVNFAFWTCCFIWKLVASHPSPACGGLVLSPTLRLSSVLETETTGAHQIHLGDSGPRAPSPWCATRGQSPHVGSSRGESEGESRRIPQAQLACPWLPRDPRDQGPENKFLFFLVDLDFCQPNSSPKARLLCCQASRSLCGYTRLSSWGRNEGSSPA